MMWYLIYNEIDIAQEKTVIIVYESQMCSDIEQSKTEKISKI